MGDYVYPEDVLPDMEYIKPEIKPERCGTCTHGEVTNAGAIRPGYACTLMAKLFKKAGIDNGNNHVASYLGICKHYKNYNEAEREAEANQVCGAGI